MIDLSKKNPFKVPEDYFYFFAKKMMNKIKKNHSKMDSLPLQIILIPLKMKY